MNTTPKPKSAKSDTLERDVPQAVDLPMEGIDRTDVDDAADTLGGSTTSAAGDDASTDTDDDDEPMDDAEAPLQGEGNYAAARRHRASVKKFIDEGKVEPAARDAAPDSAAEADDLAAAEETGRGHARR